MKILLLDNYDSFTYNLLHVVKELGYTDIEVFRNDRISLDEVNRFDKIILSPGPGIPAEAGLLLPIIKQYAPTKSILGVCLGHQAIGEAFGATLENLVEVYHGVQTLIDITGKDILFQDLEHEIPVGRYHSWVVWRSRQKAKRDKSWHYAIARTMYMAYSSIPNQYSHHKERLSSTIS